MNLCYHMPLDGEEVAVGPDDITTIYPGGSYKLANDGDEELRVLVIGLR